MCNYKDPLHFFGGWVGRMGGCDDNLDDFGEDPYDVGESYDHCVWVRRRRSSVEMILIMFT